MMFCNKTNADGVSLHQFPADEIVRRQWLHLFDGHHLRVTFAATIFQLTDETFGAKNAGFSSKVVLKKSTVPSIHGSPTPEQVKEDQRMKTKLPLCNEQSRVEDSSSVVTQETYTETLFLDTIVYKDTRFKDQTILDVKTRFKPTKTFHCTHFTSCHAPNMKNGFVKVKVRPYESLEQTPIKKVTFEENISKFIRHLQDRDEPTQFGRKNTIRNQIQK